MNTYIVNVVNKNDSWNWEHYIVNTDNENEARELTRKMISCYMEIYDIEILDRDKRGQVAYFSEGG